MGDGTQGVIEGLLPGAVDHGEGKVSFALYAPGKKSVHLIGSFNDWNRQSDPMRDTGGGLWALQKELTSGPAFYQFLIDQSLIICDPYATAVEFRPERPDEPAWGIIDVGHASFKWQHDGWLRPGFQHLIFYELHIGDFCPEHTFRGVIERLDYLKDLGVNALELMPVYQPKPDDYWGYAPMFFLAPRRSYGTADDLRTLVDLAHDKGMAIILDMVLSHTSPDHPFNKMYPYEQSPWYGRTLGGQENLFGLPSLDYTKPPTNGFIHDVQSYWLREFHVDGFRYDYLPAIGTDEKEKGIPYLIRTAREIRPDAYLIGEYLPEKPEVLRDSELSGIWHGRTEYELRPLLMQRNGDNKAWDEFDKTILLLDPKDSQYHTAAFLVNYVETHDENRLALELQDAGLPADQVLRRLMLGATILFTMPGEPMLYQGQEWGENTAKNMKGNSLHWERLESDDGRRLHQYYQKLIRLRREHGSLASENFAMDTADKDRKLLVFHRWFGSEHTIVAANFSSDRQTLDVTFPNTGEWLDFFADAKVKVDKTTPVELEGTAARIFLWT